MTFLYIEPPAVLFLSELRCVFIKVDLDERKMLMGSGNSRENLFNSSFISVLIDL